MKKILIPILFGITFQLSAQTMYSIIVANTEDSSIGKSCEIDQMMMIAEMNTVAKSIGYEIIITTISHSKFCFEEVDYVIKNLKCNSNDIIWFYYTGHGFNKTDHASKWPVMALNTGGFPLDLIHIKLMQKGARLNVTMGDCCNNILDASKAINKNLVVADEDISSKEKIYKNLFLKPKGNILVSSSEKGESSYSHPYKGSYFTDEFNKALVYAVNYSNTLSWEALLNDVKNRVLRLNSNEPQTVQFEINLENLPQPPTPVPEYTNINKYLNDLADENIPENERKSLLNDYQKYFTKNARTDIFVGEVMTDMKTIEDFLERIYLHATKINTINLIENKSKTTGDGKKYQQITVQEVWGN